MTPTKRNLRELLDEIIPSPAEDCGPSLADLSGMLQRERRRRRVGRGATLLALLALISGLTLWRNERATWSQYAEGPAKPSSILVQEVNDDQLLSLLQGTPAALMEWPNGERTLLFVEY